MIETFPIGIGLFDKLLILLFPTRLHQYSYFTSSLPQYSYFTREGFANRVRETAGPDVAKMGIKIISFVIKDVADQVVLELQAFCTLRGQGGYLGVRLWKMSLNTLLIEGVMVVI